MKATWKMFTVSELYSLDALKEIESKQWVFKEEKTTDQTPNTAGIPKASIPIVCSEMWYSYPNPT